MIYYTNDCCDCGLPCILNTCPHYKVKHYKCDICGEIDIKLYHCNDMELCEDCLLKEFEVVDGSDYW